ncbi:MAG TPA: hypothetical protein VJB39_00370 [Patescibacteria group bacterium]|nr:hypothetical protein [Patescibacteria group bacterium]
MKKLLLLIPAAILILSGCVVNIKTSGGVDGGVYKSDNSGDLWEQATLVYRVGDVVKTFSTVDLSAMVLDPTDRQAIYIGTEEKGMYYTYDGGVGWHQTLDNLGRINDIAVSPKERCIIYVAIGNRVYKSTDCNRHWNYQLIETRDDPNNQINSLTIDGYDTDVIYAGTSGKGLFRSEDGGLSWHAVKFFDGRVAKVLVNPNDTRVIYAATDDKGIFKSSDRGASWRDLLTKQLREDKENLEIYRDLILDPTVSDGILYASQYGLLRSADGGNTFEEIPLLTPPSTTAIYSLAINPRNGQEMYYGIATALYRSIDGGQNWTTRALPSSRAARFLLIDPEEPARLYLGVKKIKK